MLKATTEKAFFDPPQIYFSQKTVYGLLSKCLVQIEGKGLQFEVDKQIINESLITLNKFKSPEFNGLYPRELKSWMMGEVPDDWRRCNIPSFKKAQKEEL